MSVRSPDKAGRVLLWVPLLPALIVRVLSLKQYVSGNPFANHLFSDAHNYHQWAAAIASGNPPLEPFYQAPLYPHFLALLLRFPGDHFLPIYMIQLILGVLSVHIVSRLALLFLRPLPSAIAATLFGLLPYSIYFEHKLYPEPLSLVVALLALYMGARDWKSARGSVWAGAAAGLAATARANLIAFGLLLPLSLLRNSPGRSFAYLAAFAMLVLPVTVWNVATGGGLTLVAANGGEVFCHGNNSNALGSMGKIPGFKSEIGSMAKSSIAFASKETGRELNSAGASRYWFARGLRWIARNPAASVRLEIRKAYLIFSSRFTPLSSFYDFEKERFTGDAIPWHLLHYPLWILALAGLLLRRRGGLPIPGAIHLYAAIQFLTLMLFFVSTRYVILLLPVIALYAGAGVEAILYRRRRAGVVAVLVAGLLVAIWADRSPGRERATPYAQLASIRISEGNRTEAIALFAEAARLSPMELIHHQNLAMEREKEGDIAGAREAMEVPIRMGIADGRTLGYYGSLLIAQQEWELAEKYLGEAVNAEPNRLLSRLLLGEVYLRMGKWREAEETLLHARRIAPADPRPLRGLLGLYSGPLNAPERAKELSGILERLK